MADVQRTRAAILALFADNVTGQISAQDLRDFIVTVMESDFVNPGDFWAQPTVANHTTDKTVKGWVQYSQLIRDAVSFGKVMYMTNLSGWAPADVAASTTHKGVLGVAANSYAANESQAQILRQGLVYDSGLSARFSGSIGAFLYLQSALLGSISVTIGTSVRLVGYVEQSANGDATSGHWRFAPVWGVVA